MSVTRAQTVTASCALCALCAGASGCLPHTLVRTAPPATAPYALRAQYYRQTRPTGAALQLVTSYSRYGGRSTSVRIAGVTLADGTPIYYSSDLLPAVRPDSLTAQAIDEERQASYNASLITGVSLGLSAAGLAGTLLTILSSGRGSTPVAPLVLFVSVTVGSLTTATVGGLLFASQASIQRERALYTFDQSLRARLNLCGDGTVPGDCAEMPSHPFGPERPEIVATPTTSALRSAQQME